MTNHAGIRSINPASGEVLEEFVVHTESEVEACLERSLHAANAWRETSFAERSTLLLRIANLLRKDRQRLACDITQEMGKPVAEAEAEVDKCAWNCRYVAEMGAQWLRDEPAGSSATESYISYLPLGVVLAVMPWNFPLWQVFRFAAPALMAGNTVLLKHAPNVTRCAINIEDVGLRAGLLPGLLQNLIVPVDAVPALIRDDRIAAVTLTGSPRAGAVVAAIAGAALKKSVLELGGSDAFIVLADADLDAAVEAGIRGRFANCGQVCLAPKRFILSQEVADEFEKRFSAAAAKLRVGDPLDRSKQMGPMARADLLEELDRQVQDSIRAGARVSVGGMRLNRPGNYYSPTVLTQVTEEMPVAREETFGPVAALIRVKGSAEALELANRSVYGLSSNVWTKDLSRARELARTVRAGGVFINGASVSDPRLPIGGVKRSGYGRELACVGIREFVNIQTVWIGPALHEDKKAITD